jgi:hypothetical protein
METGVTNTAELNFESGQLSDGIRIWASHPGRNGIVRLFVKIKSTVDPGELITVFFKLLKICLKDNPGGCHLMVYEDSERDTRPVCEQFDYPLSMEKLFAYAWRVIKSPLVPGDVVIRIQIK